MSRLSAISNLEGVFALLWRAHPASEFATTLHAVRAMGRAQAVLLVLVAVRSSVAAGLGCVPLAFVFLAAFVRREPGGALLWDRLDGLDALDWRIGWRVCVRTIVPAAISTDASHNIAVSPRGLSPRDHHVVAARSSEGGIVQHALVSPLPPRAELIDDRSVSSVVRHALATTIPWCAASVLVGRAKVLSMVFLGLNIVGFAGSIPGACGSLLHTGLDLDVSQGC